MGRGERNHGGFGDLGGGAIWCASLEAEEGLRSRTRAAVTETILPCERA